MMTVVLSIQKVCASRSSPLLLTMWMHEDAPLISLFPLLYAIAKLSSDRILPSIQCYLALSYRPRDTFAWWWKLVSITSIVHLRTWAVMPTILILLGGQTVVELLQNKSMIWVGQPEKQCFVWTCPSPCWQLIHELLWYEKLWPI